MLQSFKSMNELVEYLGGMEKRLRTLEEENRALRLSPAGTDTNMNELVEYLQGVEGRLKYLEGETEKLSTTPVPASSTSIDKEAIARQVAYFLPQTNIIHPNFWKRAWAVWGHYAAVQLIISAVLMVFYCLLFFLTFIREGVR